MSLNRYDCVRPFGELAQLVECCDRTAEARGSNPLFSIRPGFPDFKDGESWSQLYLYSMRLILLSG
jgi:hypothetical protein